MLLFWKKLEIQLLYKDNYEESYTYEESSKCFELSMCTSIQMQEM